MVDVNPDIAPEGAENFKVSPPELHQHETSGAVDTGSELPEAASIENPDNDGEAHRNATPQDVERMDQEAEGLYSGAIDEIIGSREEKGQYYAVFGKPASTADQPDGRVVFFAKPAEIKTDGKEGPHYIGLTRDGFVAVPMNTYGGELTTRAQKIQNQLRTQIGEFYSAPDKAQLSPYPMESEYQGESWEDKADGGGKVERNAYLKDAKQGSYGRITFGAGTDDIMIYPANAEQPTQPKVFDDIETAKQVIAGSQQEARSPFEADAARAQAKLAEARNVASFISSLPPKV